MEEFYASKEFFVEFVIYEEFINKSLKKISELFHGTFFNRIREGIFDQILGQFSDTFQRRKLKKKSEKFGTFS